jgi:hypothetical protein
MDQNIIKNDDEIDIKQQIIQLKFDESIFINIDDENIYKKIELINIQKQSYENLFMSYINNTCESANEFNLNQFLEKYTNLCYEQNDLIKSTIINLLGTDVYMFLNILPCIEYNFTLNGLLISKKIIMKNESMNCNLNDT